MKSLPVVERCYQLLVQLVQAVGQFPRQPRYLLGERLETCCLDLLDCLLEAQSGRGPKLVLRHEVQGRALN